MTRTDSRGTTREPLISFDQPPLDARIGVTVACPVCELSAGPFSACGEALLLADRHDQVHHRGRRTTQVSDQGVCESCGRAPATTTWTRPEAGAPFALCAGCYPDPPVAQPAPHRSGRGGRR